MLSALEFSLQNLLNGWTNRAEIFRVASLDHKEVLLEISAQSVQPRYQSENSRALCIDISKRGSLSSHHDEHLGWSYIQNCSIHYKTSKYFIVMYLIFLMIFLDHQLNSTHIFIFLKKTSTNIIYILSYQINWTGQQLISSICGSIPKRLKTVINIEHKQINKVLYI